jgi:hypothetical protein
MSMRIDDLGFVKKTEVPLGKRRWLTVVSPQDPTAAELPQEPDSHCSVGAFHDALIADGTPCESFLSMTSPRRSSGSERSGSPSTRTLQMGPVTRAFRSDTCRSLRQIAGHQR